MRLSILFLVSAFFFSAIYASAYAADPGHPASDISPGTFETGDYIFPQNLNVSGNISVGNSTLFVDNTQGRVGIGTTAPQQSLHIKGSNPILAIDSDTGNPFLKLLDGGTERWSISNYGAIDALIFREDADYNKVRMAIQDSTGNVGIGNTSPGEKLVVNGSLRVDNTSGDAKFFMNATSGNLGIGTSNPSYKLDIVKLGETNIPTLRISATNNSGAYAYMTFREDSENNDWSVGLYDSSPNSFRITESNDLASSVRLSIEGSSGNVGIGTVAPSAMLEVNGSSNHMRISYNSSQHANLSVDSSGNLLLDPTGSVYFQSSDYYVNPTGEGYFNNIRTTGLDLGWDSAYSISAKGSSGNLKILARSAGSAGGTLTIGKNGETLLINSSNVGIGNTSPGEKLVINGSLRVDNESGSPILFVNSTSGNVGIGTTSQGNKLYVSGSIGLTGYIYGYGGSAELPSYTFGGDTDTGMLRPAVNTIAFSINATELLRLDSTGNVGIGNTTPTTTLMVNGTFSVMNNSGTQGLYQDANGSVGIGTANPGAKLEVNGNIYASTGDTYNIGTAGSTNRFAWIYATGFSSGSAASGLRLGTGAVQPIIFQINGVEKVRIDSAGKVGIGNTTPSTTLMVNGTFSVMNSSGAQGLYQDSNGRVGIGNASPGQALAVEGNILLNSGTNSVLLKATSAGGQLSIRNSADNDYAQLMVGNIFTWNQFYLGSNAAIGSAYNTTNSGITLAGGFNAATAEGAKINLYGSTHATNANQVIINGAGQGNVGIGTSSPSTTLDVNGTLDFSDVTGDVSFFDNETIGNATDGSSLYVRRHTDEGDNYLRLYVNQYKNPSVYASGTLVITGSTVRIDSNAAFGQYPSTNHYIRYYGDINDSENYIQWLVNNYTDSFELTRQDANITKFDVQMPTQISDSLNVTANISTPTLCLNGDCQSSWPSVTGGWTNDSSTASTSLNVNLTSGNLTVVNGNVGIGTEAPSEKLAISGGSVVLDNSIYYKVKDSGGTARGILTLDGGDDTRLQSPSGEDLEFWPGAVEKVIITSNGLVGIGNTTPSTTLFVNGTFSVMNASGMQGIYQDANGSVGIGNTSPSTKLEVVSNSADIITVRRNGTANLGSTILFKNSDNSEARLTFAGDESFSIWNQGWARLSIPASGSIGINTTTPQSTLQIGNESDSSPDYLQIDTYNGAPPSGDCDSDMERGRMVLDYSGNRTYICNGAARGWDYIDLSD